MRDDGIGWSRVRGLVAAAVVAACGILGSAAAGAQLRQAHLQQAEQRVDQAGRAVQAAVTDQLHRYVDAVEGTAAVLSTHPELDAAAFSRSTLALTTQRLTGAKAVSLLVTVPDHALPVAQAHWRARGATGLRLRPGTATSEHLFAIFSRGLGGDAAAPGGLDNAAAPAATAAIRRARDTGRAAISDGYVLVSDAGLPADRRQLSFLVTAPVRNPNGAVVGYLALGVRGTDFMTTTLDLATRGTVDAQLLTRSADGRAVPVTAVMRPDRDADLRRDISVEIAQRQWIIRTSADERTLMPPSTRTDLVVAGAGSLLSVLFGLLLHVQVSGRRRAEAAVRAATAESRVAHAQAHSQAELLNSVLNSISDGVGVVDETGAVLVHNPAAAALLGNIPPGTDPEQWPRAFGLFQTDGVTPFPSAELPLIMALAGQPQDNVAMVVRNELHPQGAAVTVSTRPLDGSAGRRGAVAVVHDVTDRTRADRELAATTARLQAELAQRRAAEEQLRSARDALAEQKAYLTQVLDALEISVLTCDTEGRVRHANRAARAGLPGRGAKAASADSTVATELHHVDATRLLDLRRPDGSAPEAAQLPWGRALRGAVVEGEEFTVLRSGRLRTVEAHARPLRHDAGHVIGAVISTYDITALREREADLTAFAGVVAHDLNSPLASIGGYAELLEEDLAALPGPAGAAARRHLSRVTATVDRMRQLIEDLLAFTAAGDAKLSLTTVDLRAVVDDVVTARLEGMLACGGGQVIAPDVYVGPLPPIQADAGMVRQLIDNLIGNALKYTPPGRPARIDITARPDATPGLVRVEIADRGIGIPDGQHHAIFDGFHRAHHDAGYAGTGLGLAICQRVVERHGGSIGVTDNPGGGARFHLTLPAGTAVRPAELAC